MASNFKEVTETPKNRFAESNLGKQTANKAIHDSGNEVDKPLTDIPGKKGGSYKDVHTEGEGDRYEVHHMPADSASRLDRNDGPAIKMDKADHRQTASCGMSAEAREYREKQKELIDKGKFSKAYQMDVDDIHSKFGNKYDEHIAQSDSYVKQLKKEGKI